MIPRTSQGHNALPRLGLEPGSSDSEPSALTTGLLDKAVPAIKFTTHVKSSTLCGRSYGRKSKFFSGWWVTTTILYNYGATLCELRHYLNKIDILSST